MATSDPLPAPAHIYQLDGTKFGGLNCMAASGAMALDAYSGGAIRVGQAGIRSHQSDQVGGIGLNDVAQAWKFYGQTFTYSYVRSWSAIRTRLLAGQGVVIDLTYGKLPVNWRSPNDRTFTGAHAFYLQRLSSSGSIVVDDPLRTSSAEIPESVVKAAWDGGSGWGKGVYASQGAQTGTVTAAAVLGLPANTPDTDSSADVIGAAMQRVKPTMSAAKFARLGYSIVQAQLIGDKQGVQLGIGPVSAGTLSSVTLGNVVLNASDYSLASVNGASLDPLGMIGSALGALPTTIAALPAAIGSGLQQIAILVFILGLVFLGLYLAVKDSDTFKGAAGAATKAATLAAVA